MVPTPTTTAVARPPAAVMDSTATSLAMDNNIPVFVFALSDSENIVRAVCGEAVGTIVTK